MITTFEQALEFLYSYIPKTIAYTYSADWGLNRTKYLLNLLDNPQNKIKVIHIAGTSGKGSTATLTSLLLEDLGQKVGLALSPHLVDIRERMQINNQLISEQEFINYLNEIIPAIKKCKGSKFGMPTYFELVTILAFYIFDKQKVDFAVTETGLGGLYDATNSVDNPEKLAVLTKIGLDHTAILGKTIPEIAYQKAGIIHSGNAVFSTEQIPEATEVIDKTALENHVKATYIKHGENFDNIKLSSEKTLFDFNFQNLNLKDLELNMLGEHQAENCSLALSVVYSVSQKYGFDFNEQKARETLKKAVFPGRFEIIHKDGKLIIIDGAHNPQKMMSFLNSVKQIYPEKKFNFLVAFKKDKDYTKILQEIIPFAKKILITTFFIENMDLIRFSEDPAKLVKILKELNFEKVEIIKDNKLALEKTIAESDDLIITGSLYLLGDIYPKLKNYV
ncbi:MAG: folylpolyglutamate synthase/dihydrofolate synthase family protein [Candidatus Daviesbacteria bacterium]|nr:folylpolyglutamate synthase/dihydrofolate synthase family protein [Candidatus Daviesbacteria bacterium]